MVDSPHGKGVTFTIRSRPVGYAAEYLTCGTFAPRIAPPAPRLGQRPRGICDSHGQISTHFYILHIIPFLGCLRLSVMLASVDLHSEKPFFPLSSSIYSIHSFPPPSHRIKETPVLPQSGAGVSPDIREYFNARRLQLTIKSI